MSRREGLIRSCVVLLAVGCSLAWSGAGVHAAEWEPGKHMIQAVGRVMGSVKKISDSTEYGYDNGVCIMAAFLRPGATVALIRPLEGGATYVILGGGDNGVDDLDIDVLDSEGRVVQRTPRRTQLRL